MRPLFLFRGTVISGTLKMPDHIDPDVVSVGTKVNMYAVNNEHNSLKEQEVTVNNAGVLTFEGNEDDGKSYWVCNVPDIPEQYHQKLLVADNKYPRPSDFIIVSKTDPFFEYVEYEKFDESVTTQRMMADDKRSDGSLYFSPESTWGGVTEITMDYYQNHILDSPSSEPLWPIELHDLLLYATCRELSTKYEHYDEDAMTVKDLSTRLNLLHKYGHHNHQIDKANSDLSPKKTDYGQPWRG
jgi:hypothetical protein